MKKLFYIFQIIVIGMLYSTAAQAWDHHGHGWGGYGGGHHGHHGWGHHHGHGGWRRPQVNNYYYPAPQPNYYYQQPPVAYAPPPPPPPAYGGYNGYYDNRSHQGLAGGVLGTVFGYELGNGHPLAAGVGAAAGSFLGNGMGWRY